MKRYISSGFLSLALVLAGSGFLGCKAVSTTGSATAPTLTFAQATNASLQAAHKFGTDIATSEQSGKLLLTAAQKQAFDAFAASLNATDAVFIAFEGGTATQAQVTTSLANTTSLQTAAQTALTGAN
jgi:hypothetical protein